MKLAAIFLMFGSLLLANSYSVPAPAELADYSRWNDISADARIQGNQLSIRYNLPTDLVGTVSTEFRAVGVVGNSSFINVAGNRVWGSCMRSEGMPLTCMLKYPKSIVDVTTRDLSLASHFKGLDFDRRLAIAKLFSADPAGLLSVEVK